MRVDGLAFGAPKSRTKRAAVKRDRIPSMAALSSSCGGTASREASSKVPKRNHSYCKRKELEDAHLEL